MCLSSECLISSSSFTRPVIPIRVFSPHESCPVEVWVSAKPLKTVLIRMPNKLNIFLFIHLFVFGRIATLFYTSSWFVCKISCKLAAKAACISSDLWISVPSLFSRHMFSISLVETVQQRTHCLLYALIICHIITPNCRQAMICQHVLTSLTSQILYFLCPNHRTPELHSAPLKLDQKRKL